MDWDALDDDWAKAPEAAEFDNVPDGTYETVTGDALIKRTKTDEPRLTVPCEIVEGPHTGRLVWYGSMFRKQSLPFLKRDLAKFGIVLASIKDIRNQDVLDRMSRVNCRIRVRTKNDFANVDLLEVYATPAEEPPSRRPHEERPADLPPARMHADVVDDDDIPF